MLKLETLPRERLRFLASQIHELGPRPLYELFSSELDAKPIFT